jgi:AhpC/TSA family protein
LFRPAGVFFGKVLNILERLTMEGQMAALKAGDTAPDFELPAVTGKDKQKFKLSDLRGKQNALVAFYPLDWSPT